MQFPADENGDVLRRMAREGFDFTKEYPIEFFALYPTEEAANTVARQYLNDHKQGDRLVKIETRPDSERGGMELMVAKSMYATHQNITEFERRLGERTAAVGGCLDGWGVLQE